MFTSRVKAKSNGRESDLKANGKAFYFLLLMKLDFFVNFLKLTIKVEHWAEQRYQNFKFIFED